ncbi:hypothetical protein [Pygmaiobacter massiliensis]|uniref:hypothetical protein n=1 Tax=Pygmaiobacter massiliensis TaxID=1917873 RepID=UPI002A8043F7|nr:hypothetical protein [Pygmaiobacter massiliensis]MDY4784387.1 hypothetical protein [Pygmaiobacter massiliensis]
MRNNPNNPNTNIIVMGYEITLGFNHTGEPNRIVPTVEQMLREIGLPQCTPPPDEGIKSA